MLENVLRNRSFCTVEPTHSVVLFKKLAVRHFNSILSYISGFPEWLLSVQVFQSRWMANNKGSNYRLLKIRSVLLGYVEENFIPCGFNDLVMLCINAGLLRWLCLIEVILLLEVLMLFKITGWMYNRKLQNVLWATVTWDVNSSRKSGTPSVLPHPVVKFSDVKMQGRL